MKNKLSKHYSIKHILNKNLKAILDPSDKSLKFYPVYVQLIWKRKNYLFKSMVTTYLTDLNYINKNDSKLMDFELEFLQDIIEFEMEQKRERFDLPGFSSRYEKYQRSVVSEAERLLIGNIEWLIRSKKSKFQDLFNYKYEHNKLNQLLEVTRVLIPKLREDPIYRTCELAVKFWETYHESFPRKEKYGLIFPTLFDWLKGRHPAVMLNIIESKYMVDEVNILIEYLNEFDLGMRTQTMGS